MGVVLLLVALPAVAVLALVVSVFDGIPAIALATMITGSIGAIVHAARGWDAPDADHARIRRTSVDP